MQGVFAARGKQAVNRDQVLDLGTLGRNHDLVCRHAQFLGAGSRQDAGLHHGFMHDGARVHRICGAVIFIHQ